jgi:hypothetical protein
MLHGRKQEEAVWKLRGGRDTREPTTSPQLAALLQLAPSVSINIRPSPAEASKLRPSNLIYMSNSKKIETQKCISTPAAN